MDLGSLRKTVGQKAFTVKTLAGAGMIRPTRPDRLVTVVKALRKYGPTPAAGYAASAARHPDELAIIDELGSLTFAEVQDRATRLCNALHDAGVREGDGVALLMRNHRGFVETVIALSQLGANGLFLNTMFSAPQIEDVTQREEPKAIVFDEEFAELVAPAAKKLKRFVAWTDGDAEHDDPVLESLIAQGSPTPRPAPSEKGRITILTSGTTGTPKGAGRKQPESLDPAASFLDRIPIKAREHTHIAAPMFHSWGFLHFTMGMGLSSTLVLRRKFTPEGMLQAVAQFECTTLAVVPVMLQRTLELDPAEIDKYDLRSLRVIAVSGSALPGELATKVMDRFGDVLYNLYGSTEVAWASIATPADMRAAPGTAGRPPFGTVVKLFDDDGKEVPTGETGRIFVGNELQFEGYTGGGDKERIQGLMSSGDVGHFDEGGRLFVDGRDDEMIVSGGENVFPREIEDVLADHPAVCEVAVVGVDDEKFGQRLAAFVVLNSGQDATEDELKKHVKAQTASYKVPRDVSFLDELPRNATGKILKKDLVEA